MLSNYIILGLIFLPVVGFLLTLLCGENQEKRISQIAFYTIASHFFGALGFIVYWLVNGAMPINLKEYILYESHSYVFLIDFYWDGLSAVYCLVAAFISFLIVRYSRYYMHLEKGYKRFFSTILFFYFAYNFTVLSGNFETLFIGWEMIGISSFLLIAFYRERYLPVRNAVKVFSVYRIGDIGILLAMWGSHHLWHDNITFLKLHNTHLVASVLAEHPLTSWFIGSCLLVAAAAKSGQFPFSSWVPRAMEGPTPSSAIFYGSLSIHFGLFLLIRTMPFWEPQWVLRLMIGFVGFTTAIVGYFTAKAQPTIKTQIAYASVAQIGLMFVELSLGFTTLAVVHFVGNAFLRTYQLLVSPSVVSYLIREQFYHFRPYQTRQYFPLGKSIHYGLYLLALREFYLDTLMSKIIFNPFKKIGSRLNFLTYRNVFYYFVPTYLLGWLAWFFKAYLPASVIYLMPELAGAIALLMIMKAFSEREYPLLAWLMVVQGHFWIALAVMHNDLMDWQELLWYLSGVVVAGWVGWVCLLWLRKKEPKYFNLYRYYGHNYEYQRLGGLFFFCTLGLMGFPITTTFIGEDLVFSHVSEKQFVLAFFLSSCFVIGGIALIRIYARLFLGNHAKVYHENPLQSS
ncbi:MAG: hypothetical protein EAZ55_09220 [Cytophagales bacterium]|nr:MAG: hypothetical protein EAZ55_09220 [Cytophagales bacterium]